MEQNREPRKKSTHLQPSDLWQTWQKQAMGKGFPVQQMVLGKLASHIQKKETEPISYTIYKDQLKMHWRLKCKTQNYKKP